MSRVGRGAGYTLIGFGLASVALGDFAGMALIACGFLLWGMNHEARY